VTLSTDVVEFLRGERRPMKRQELAASIQREATHNPAWPKATFEQWTQAINDAVRAGELVLDGETVRLAVKPSQSNEKQLDLF
jgi:hypothetical protein